MHTFVRIDIMVVRPPVEVRIHHLHIFHNAPYLPPPPQFYITFVFHFSLVLQPFQEKVETTLMQNIGGQIRSIMREAQVVNTSQNCGSFRSHNQKCSTVLPEFWYKVALLITRIIITKKSRSRDLVTWDVCYFAYLGRICTSKILQYIIYWVFNI